MDVKPTMADMIVALKGILKMVKMSTDDMEPQIKTLMYTPPLPPADKLRLDADKIEERDARIQHARDILAKATLDA